MTSSYGVEESYFSCSVHTLGEPLRPRLGRQDSGEDVLFNMSGCNTPTPETAPALKDGIPASPSANQHGARSGTLRPDKSKTGMLLQRSKRCSRG